MKAIETSYDGYLFRSRLEARWAVFFNKLGIKYEYEKEGYFLGNGVKYLPDFWLPEILLRDGIVDKKFDIGYALQETYGWKKMLKIVGGIDGIVGEIKEGPGLWLEVKGIRPTYDESMCCFLLGILTKRPVLLTVGLPKYEIFQEYPPWETNMFFYKCYGCGNIKVVSTENTFFHCSKCNEKFDSQHSDIYHAIKMSKHARFEYGKSG